MSLNNNKYAISHNSRSYLTKHGHCVIAETAVTACNAITEDSAPRPSAESATSPAPDHAALEPCAIAEDVLLTVAEVSAAQCLQRLSTVTTADEDANQPRGACLDSDERPIPNEKSFVVSIDASVDASEAVTAHDCLASVETSCSKAAEAVQQHVQAHPDRSAPALPARDETVWGLFPRSILSLSARVIQTQRADIRETLQVDEIEVGSSSLQHITSGITNLLLRSIFARCQTKYRHLKLCNGRVLLWRRQRGTGHVIQ